MKLQYILVLIIFLFTPAGLAYDQSEPLPQSVSIVGLYPTGEISQKNESVSQLIFEYQSDPIVAEQPQDIDIKVGRLEFKNWRCQWFYLDKKGDEFPFKNESLQKSRLNTFRLKCYLEFNPPFFNKKLGENPQTNDNGIYPSPKQQKACRPEVLLVPASGLYVQPTIPRPSFISRLFGSEAPERLKGSSQQPENLVMFLVDALRADHTPSYGHPFVIAPHIDMLASLGTLFEQSYGASSSTRPSVGSIFSGLHPIAHGAVRHATLAAFLHDGVPLFAEFFDQKGYSTVGVSSNGQIIPAYGFKRGFDELQSPVWDNQVTPFGLEHLEYIDEPFFMYLHYIAPHTPYEPPVPYKGLYDGLTEYEEQDAYCGEITLDDRRVGQVLKVLAKQGLLDRTLIWLVSDHGEEFWEHGWKEHGVTVYEESIRTVSIISYPQLIPMGKRIDVPVTHVDVFPTLVEMLEWEPPKFLYGKSLMALLRNKENSNLFKNRPIYLHHGGGKKPAPHFSDKEGILLEDLKLIWWTQKDEWELYDLISDPGEKRNLMGTGKELDSELTDKVNKMKKLLKKHLENCRTIGKYYEFPDEAFRNVVLSPEEKENLMHLGYIQQ